MDKKELDFLFVEMFNNSHTVGMDTGSGSLSGLTPQVLKKYEELYKKHINSAVNLDPNCSSCLVRDIRALYTFARRYKEEAETSNKEDDNTIQETQTVQLPKKSNRQRK